MSLADRKRLPYGGGMPPPEPGFEWVFDPITFAAWQRKLERTDRSDAGVDIVMKHTNIRGNEMTETDKERQARTGLSSLRITDDESKAVQKTPNRVSLDSLLMKIVSEEFLYPVCLPSMTICVLMLRNGYVLVGKSTPADPGNFDAELGKKFAKEDAIRQMWQLEGYLLREQMSSPRTRDNA